MRGARIRAWALLCLVLGGWFGTARADEAYEQRQLYLKALTQLTSGQQRAFRDSRKALDDYVLAPYLDLRELLTRLSSLTADEVVGFVDAHPDIPAARRLFDRWLINLGRRGRWREFLEYHVPDGTALRECLYLRALHATGAREEALAKVEPLWLVGKSQPEECDPIFELWIESGGLTQDIAWQRLERAIEGNRRVLARYLQRFLTGTYATRGEALYRVHVQPKHVTNQSQFRADDVLNREVIAHGLRRLARNDPETARSTWQSYRQTHEFSEAERHALDDYILIALARENEFPEQLPARINPVLSAGMADAAINNANFEAYRQWYPHLSDTERNLPRWRYWMARSGAPDATTIYREIASDRSYYGFLAADQLGIAPSFNAHDTPRNDHLINTLVRVPGVHRAMELVSVGDELNARREWHQLMRTLSAAQRAQAAHLAASIGWSYQSIVAANSADLRDDLALRFPTDHIPTYRIASHQTDLPVAFLLAVTRQESAFWTRARSPANARGLMQLLHGTARLVARRIGAPAPSMEELYQAETNIRLGAHHLAHLMARYGDRRTLAAAAYNAGENRVDRWIEDRSGTSMDIWIESIPFAETRNYVQNVITYHQVYAYRLGTRFPMLTAAERSVP